MRFEPQWTGRSSAVELRKKAGFQPEKSARGKDTSRRESERAETESQHDGHDGGNGDAGDGQAPVGGCGAQSIGRSDYDRGLRSVKKKSQEDEAVRDRDRRIHPRNFDRDA